MNEIICCVCGNEVEKLEPLESGCLDSSGHIEVSFGYGSKNDTETYTGYIHDDCFESFKNKMMVSSFLDRKI
jgi:hypothetical protein